MQTEAAGERRATGFGDTKAEGPVRRIVVVVAACVAAVVMSLVLAPATVSAQDNPSPQETIKAPTALPQPNSGKEAEYQGDRGTATQYLVMTGIIGGLVVMGLLIRRESRSKLARQGRSTSTPSIDG